MPPIYHLIPPQGKKVPLLVSVPHCGTAFPEDIRHHYRAEAVRTVDDTDFFVHRVYDFVSDLGITMIHAHYHRWVIDLNRSAENQALYNDGRIITALTPTTDFLGNPIYQSKDLEPDAAAIQQRKEQYYFPYYDQIQTILDGFKAEFGFAILWDAHSIRASVPSIHAAPFPDLILGTNDGASAAGSLIQTAQSGLAGGPYELSYNYPFKGGNITRHFGQPQDNIHALQLEMTKLLYMDDAELAYHPERAAQLQQVLRPTLAALAAVTLPPSGGKKYL